MARWSDDWTEDDDELAAELSAHLTRPPGTEDEMPEAEELLAYLDGSLPPDEEARVGKRLVEDPRAARALLDLAELDAAARGPVPAAPDLAARSAWRELRGRLGDRPEAAGPPGGREPLHGAGRSAEGTVWWRRPALWAAAAAALLSDT